MVGKLGSLNAVMTLEHPAFKNCEKLEYGY